MATSKTAFVAGGTGNIGEGIVKTLMEMGYDVFVPTRAVDHSERLSAYVQASGPGRLRFVKAELGDLKTVEKSLKEVLKESGGKLDLVVVSVGKSFYGNSLHHFERTEWDRLIDENLVTHFNLIKVYLKALHEQGSGVYVTLTGPEANFVHPETGLMSIVASAQKTMANVAAMEAHGTEVRVYSLTSKTPVATRSRGEQAGGDWVTATDIGRYISALVSKKVAGTDQAVHVMDSHKVMEKVLKNV